MFKNNETLKQIIVLVVFAIFAISSLTLVDSANAIAINSNQESNNENSDSVDEESLEPITAYFEFENRETDTENEIVKARAVIINNENINNENSEIDNKTIEKNSTKNIEIIDEYKNVKVITVNTAKAAENVSDTSSNSINENSIDTGDQNDVDSVTRNYGVTMPSIQILIVIVLLIASFSFFILYVKN